MWEQIVWVLVSVGGALVMWLPGLGTRRSKLSLGGQAIIGRTAIAINVAPWLWLPFTTQPRILGMLGAALTAIGISFFIFGIALCSKAYRIIHSKIGWGHADPSGLVRDGAYGFVRHPIYSGLTVAALGWALMWGGVYAILLTPVFYVLLRIEAWIEEKLLEKKFGEAYTSYRSKVPAFFPTVLLVALLILALFISLSIWSGWIPLIG